VRTRSNIGVALLVGLALAGAAGCSSDDSNDAGDRTEEHSRQSASSTPPGGSPSTVPQTSGVPNTAVETPPVGANLRPPIGVGEPADFGDGVVVEVTEFEDIDAEGGAPGETSGPAVKVALDARNGSSATFDLGLLAVTATYGDDVPAIASSADPAKELVGELAVGKRSSGVFVFRVPDGQADSMVVSIQSAASADIVVVRR